MFGADFPRMSDTAREKRGLQTRHRVIADRARTSSIGDLQNLTDRSRNAFGEFSEHRQGGAEAEVPRGARQAAAARRQRRSTCVSPARSSRTTSRTRTRRSTERAPLTDHVTVAFIGGGFAGLVTGARLKEQGIDDVRIIEKGGDFGGTWYWNRYPGAQCDTASFVYMPLLEETGHMPTREVRPRPGDPRALPAHRQAVRPVRQRAVPHRGHRPRVGRRQRAAGSSAPTAATSSPRSSSRMGTGPLHVPKLPGIPGIDDFKGHSFHTSRWDYDYTGGDRTGAPMDKLADKRVGIIGTGATARAVHPAPRRARAESCTCSSARRRRSTCAPTIRSTPSGSPRSTRRAGSSAGSRTSPPTRPMGIADEDLVMDGWTDLSRRIREKIIGAARRSDDTRRG